ncbi:N-acetyltransferase [Clostridiales bacterium COT073_COT-073]|nr:N-acetyltransferase [Clostridiales bacterium COT073_COT-073]
MNWQIEENNLDYKTYFALRESVGWSNFSPKQAEIAIANSYYSIVVKDLENEIAMGRVAGDGMYFTIVDIVVKPEFQGRGIGTMILQAILKHIERNLPEGSRASIGLISEIGKESFYIKQGFKLIPHQFCGCALRKIILK